MKITTIAICIAASAVLYSCDRSSRTEDSATSIQAADMDAGEKRESASATVETNDVPVEIRTSFQNEYPAIQRTEWVRYQPGDDDDFDRDMTYYYVRFNNNGEDYINWYNNRGERVKTSTVLSGNPALPDAVNDYLHTNYEGYLVESISKENDKNTDMYEIKLSKGDDKVKLKLLPNGEVFKKKTN